jgi:hypothetical protein
MAAHATMNTATEERFLLCGPCLDVIGRTISELNSVQSRVEAGSNTSTVALRVVGGDEKESLKSETVKIWSRVPRDSDPRMTALERASSNCK